MSLTLEQVGKLAGVSRSTVSRVINDHPSVRDDVRERVWEVIHQTGYQPHAAARSLVTRRTQIIGVIIPETVNRLFTEPFFLRLIQGITEGCNARGYHLMLSLLTSRDRREATYRNVIRNGYLDGLIVASAELSDSLIPDLQREEIPFVLVGRHTNRHVHYVDAGNVVGARTAVEHLIRLGHRRIGIITGRLDTPGGDDRFRGYRQGLEAHHIPLDDGLIAHGDFTEGSGMAGMQELLPASPTAVFVSSDTMAIGALKVLRQTGRRVPQDVALIGFDDIPLSSAVEPPLTTVRQPIAQMGETAVEILLSLLDHPGAEPQAVILPTELIIRESC